MTYTFSDTELQSIQDAYNSAATGANSWANVYQTISKALTYEFASIPKLFVDPAVWVWINGACDVNAGVGVDVVWQLTVRLQPLFSNLALNSRFYRPRISN
jgi:hypothetical protein